MINETKIQITLISAENDFKNLQPAWNRLLESALDSNIFLSHQWLYSWWMAYSVKAELFIIIAKINTELVGIAPLMIKQEKKFGLTYKALFFIGDGTYETDHMNFIIHKDYFRLCCC